MFGYKVDLVDFADLAAVRAAMKPDTKLVWIETPGNPLWNITDITGGRRDRARGWRRARHRLDRRDAGVHAADRRSAPTS